MIEFKRKYTMQNGNKVTKKNWHKVVAVHSEPNTNTHGVPEIEAAKREKGAYFNKYHLKLEDEGYIFREINTNSGINGHHETFKVAIWTAMTHRIRVFLED